MLLNIYLGSIVINWTIMSIFVGVCNQKLKRKGYKQVKETPSLLEIIFNFLSTAFKGAIPIYNILVTILLLCKGDQVYEILESKLLKEGNIYIPNKECASDKEEILFGEKADVRNMTGVREETQHNGMTKEEWLKHLEKEKEFLYKMGDLIGELANNEKGTKEQQDIINLYNALFDEYSKQEQESMQKSKK